MAKYRQKEREIIITYSDKPAPDNLPTSFIDFIKEMRRVVDARKEREAKEKEREKNKIEDN